MLTSVIVTIYNRADLSKACVTSLDEHGRGDELVLVDNGSTDDTPSLYHHADRLVRLTDNIGFTRAANQAGFASIGDVLVLLNNDTEVHTGWLDAILANFNDPLVGIVGCRLLFPDGTLQHGGVKIVEINGQVHGQHDDSAPLERRDVQAVTGACMAIRRQVWDDLDGFDEGFWNGNEDVDLCLRAREAGWVVRYEPDAVVTHHEGASGPSRWFKVNENVLRLTEKWLGKVTCLPTPTT